jgi:hypothetical protein
MRANPVTVEIAQWTEGPAWNAWSVQAKTHLVDLLKPACPTLPHTEIKRLARSILGRERSSFELADEKTAHSVVSFLQGLGATVAVVLASSQCIANTNA